MVDEQTDFANFNIDVWTNRQTEKLTMMFGQTDKRTYLFGHTRTNGQTLFVHVFLSYFKSFIETKHSSKLPVSLGRF